MHVTFCETSDFSRHNYRSCQICCKSSHGCSTVKRYLQCLLDENKIQIYQNREDYDVNMVDFYPRNFQVFDVAHIKEPLVLMHASLYELDLVKDSHATCGVCSRNPRGCLVMRRDIQRLLEERTITITYNRDDGVNMIGCYLHELLVSDINSVTLEANIIIPHFKMPDCVEVTYNE